MNYMEQLEQVEFKDKSWYKIKEDMAFHYVIEDWYKCYGEMYCRHVKDFNVAVQAGGFCGVYPRMLGEKFNAVYTFEPDPLNFFCLTLNCQSTNIIKAQGALGKHADMVGIIPHAPHNRGMNRVIHVDNLGFPTYRIDDLALPTCDLIQLDTEGYEYNILQGAENTIAKFKPVVTVEDTNEQIETLLFKYGYVKKIAIDRDSIYAVDP